MPVIFLICAAGQGLRMRPLQASRPKALVKIDQRTLLNWSLRSLPVSTGDSVIIIGQKADALESQSLLLRADFPDWDIRFTNLDGPTRGQLHTAMIALNDNQFRDHALVVYNCDTYFESASLASLMARSHWDGLIPCAQVPGEMWSFCAVGSDQLTVTQVAEKKRIAPWCSVGFYFFRDLERFRKYASLELQTTEGECFVAPLFNRYIQDGYAVAMVPCEEFKPMGSPEQIETFWGMDRVS